ncbi:MAG: hypothetical protein WCA07_06030 [Gloeobacterales cyanobacterium]
MKKIGIHLLLCLLLSSSPVWAYVPLKGLSQDALNSPVVARSVTSSMADQDGQLNSNWDTTIVLQQKDSRDVSRVDVAFTLLGSLGRSVLTRKVSLTREQPWKQGEKWSYRLQQQHLGWPGDSTMVQVTAVFFTNGEFWENTEDSEHKEVMVIPETSLSIIPVPSTQQSKRSQRDG